MRTMRPPPSSPQRHAPAFIPTNPLHAPGATLAPPHRPNPLHIHPIPLRARPITPPTPPPYATTRPPPPTRIPLIPKQTDPHPNRPTTPLPPPPAPPPPPSPQLSLLLLTLVTVLWGTQHAIIKLSVHDSSLPPCFLTCLRFSLAALVTVPFVPSLNMTTRQWRYGMEQAVWMFAGYAMQAVALETTSATRSGFLLYLNVKFVPLLARVLYGRRMGVGVWVSAGVAFVGTLLLTYDGMSPVVGDAWSVGAALASAMFIVRLETATRYVEAAELSAMTIVGVALLSGVWSVVEFVCGGGVLDIGAAQGWQAWVGVVYLGVVTTALSNYLQTVGQRGLKAERAAVVYAMDPVYGAVFASVLLGESVGGGGLLGGGLVTAAAVWSALAASGKEGGEGR